jgi:hypothetical protein
MDAAWLSLLLLVLLLLHGDDDATGAAICATVNSKMALNHPAQRR